MADSEDFWATEVTLKLLLDAVKKEKQSETVDFKDLERLGQTADKTSIKLKTIGERAVDAADDLSRMKESAESVTAGLLKIVGGLGTFGAALGFIAGIFDSFVDAQVAAIQAGFSFSDQLLKARSSLAAIGLSFTQFTNILSEQGESLRMLGDTGAEAAKEFSQLVQVARAATASMGYYGLTSEEMANEVAELVGTLIKAGVTGKDLFTGAAEAFTILNREVLGYARLTGRSKRDIIRNQGMVDSDSLFLSAMGQIGPKAVIAATIMTQNLTGAIGDAAPDIISILKKSILTVTTGYQQLSQEEIAGLQSMGLLDLFTEFSNDFVANAGDLDDSAGIMNQFIQNFVEKLGAGEEKYSKQLAAFMAGGGTHPLVGIYQVMMDAVIGSRPLQGEEPENYIKAFTDGLSETTKVLLQFKADLGVFIEEMKMFVMGLLGLGDMSSLETVNFKTIGETIRKSLTTIKDGLASLARIFGWLPGSDSNPKSLSTAEILFGMATGRLPDSPPDEPPADPAESDTDNNKVNEEPDPGRISDADPANSDTDNNKVNEERTHERTTRERTTREMSVIAGLAFAPGFLVLHFLKKITTPLARIFGQGRADRAYRIATAVARKNVAAAALKATVNAAKAADRQLVLIATQKAAADAAAKAATAAALKATVNAANAAADNKLRNVAANKAAATLNATVVKQAEFTAAQAAAKAANKAVAEAAAKTAADAAKAAAKAAAMRAAAAKAALHILGIAKLFVGAPAMTVTAFITPSNLALDPHEKADHQWIEENPFPQKGTIEKIDEWWAGRRAATVAYEKTLIMLTQSEQEAFELSFKLTQEKIAAQKAAQKEHQRLADEAAAIAAAQSAQQQLAWLRRDGTLDDEDEKKTETSGWLQKIYDQLKLTLGWGSSTEDLLSVENKLFDPDYFSTFGETVKAMAEAAKVENKLFDPDYFSTFGETEKAMAEAASASKRTIHDLWVDALPSFYPPTEIIGNEIGPPPGTSPVEPNVPRSIETSNREINVLDGRTKQLVLGTDEWVDAMKKRAQQEVQQKLVDETERTNSLLKKILDNATRANRRLLEAFESR